ncbi:hypothetical protein Angca_001054 [Angiostrongylus cantonensis]|nr:hypothetical protein Angca_001054 [Angiostrongylus cantonensis]
MRCRSYNVSMVGGPHHSSFISQHRLCTTDRTLLAWIVAHLFINLCALVAIHTSRYRALLPYIYTNTVDLLMSSAYLVVLFVHLIRGEHVDQVRLFLFLVYSYYKKFNFHKRSLYLQTVLLFIVAVIVFKGYSVFCCRRLYWILQSMFDRRFYTHTVIVKDEPEFQL